jgi:hypothetical protein
MRRRAQIRCSRQAYPPQPRNPGLDVRPSTLAEPSTPFGQVTDGTQSAAKVVEEVVHGAKAAVDGAIVWATRKAEELSAEADSTGPYTSPATCMPSDLDAIATGVLPAMPTKE